VYKEEHRENGGTIVDDLRWGVIGFGAFADVAMGPTITNTPGHTLAAIMGRNMDRVKGYAKKYNVSDCYDRAEDLVAHPGLDAVYVATPNFQHRLHTVMAAERGLHVICEKPMAVTIAEGEEMVEACRQNGVLLMIGNMMRFNPCHPWLRGQLKRGVLGDIGATNAVLGFYLAPEYSQWRIDAGGGGAGAVMDVGVHCIDLLRYILDAEITEIASYMETKPHPFPVDIHAVLLMRYNTGALGTLYVSFDNRAPKNILEFRGSKGVAVCEGTLWRESTGQVTVTVEGSTETFEPERDTPNPYVLQIEHFRDCVREGRTPLISGEEGLKDLRVCLAAYESAESGGSVLIG
jgi:predicted dehydrogenase